MIHIDIEKARADTPSCKDIIHFNNAGASLTPTPVYEAVTNHLALENKIGGYEAAASAQDKIESFYTAFANLLGAQPDEIAYIENATRAWDMAFYAIPFKKGDRILTHQSEYASNYLAFLQLSQKTGVIIDLVPSDDAGQIDLNAIEDMITAKTKAIAITHIPSQGGLVNPAAEIGKIARKHNLIYILDACQSVGQIPVDVKEIGCDILSGTGRKFLRGPRGTGFLYINKRILNDLHPPFIDLQAAQWSAAGQYTLRDDARRFETWERHIAGQIGLAEAARYAHNIGLKSIQTRIYELADTLRTQLRDIPGIKVYDQGKELCGIVTFAKQGEDAQTIVKALHQKNINTSATLKEHARLDFEIRDMPSLVRASVHYYNTEDEINQFHKAINSM